MALALGALLVAVLALGFAAAVFFGAAAFLALGAAPAAPVALVLDAAVFGFEALGLASLASLGAFSFCKDGERVGGIEGLRTLTLGAAGFFSAGLGSFFASLTGPEGPGRHGQFVVSSKQVETIPLGCWKSPFSTPDFKALLNRESNCVSEVTVMLLFALTYFLMACRLD